MMRGHRGDLIGRRLLLFIHTGTVEILHRFNSEWFKDYGCWLEYSDKVRTAFCLCCYLFRDNNEGQARSDAFEINGWTGWNKKSRLDTHEWVKVMLITFIM